MNLQRLVVLVGVEQDRPVFKRVPMPRRLVKIPHREPPRFPSPLVFIPAVLHVTRQQHQVRLGAVRHRIGWIEPERAAEAFSRFIQSSHVLERVAQIHMTARVVRP